MKLKIGDKVYLQKCDVYHWMEEDCNVPLYVMQEVVDKGEVRHFKVGSLRDSFKFRFVFKDPKSVEWLMKQDWIVDFDKYAEVPIDYLERLREHLRKEHIKYIESYNAEDDAYKVEHYADACIEWEKYQQKKIAIENIIKYRRGECKFTFPRQYRTGTTNKPSFFARLTGRSAQ